LRANASKDEREKAFRALHSAFKKRVNEAGILSEYKRHEFFESPGEKKRRKKRESEREAQKAKLRNKKR
jgi:ribosomal protein S21